MSYRCVYAKGEVRSCAAYYAAEKLDRFLEYHAVDLIYKSYSFGNRYELAGRDEFPLAVLHAGKCFKSAELMLHVELRLKIEVYRLVFKSGSYLVLYLEDMLVSEHIR